MKPLYAIIFGLFAALVSIGAMTDMKVAPCPIPAGVTSVPIPEGVPSVLQSALRSSLGDIALPGEKFDATDIVQTGRRRRFLFAWNLGNRWIVATEHGGRGYNNPIFAYDIGDDGKTASLVETRIANPWTVCVTASKLMLRPN
jgi:hypothetical protein